VDSSLFWSYLNNIKPCCFYSFWD